MKKYLKVTSFLLAVASILMIATILVNGITSGLTVLSFMTVMLLGILVAVPGCIQHQNELNKVIKPSVNAWLEGKEKARQARIQAQ